MIYKYLSLSSSYLKGNYHSTSTTAAPVADDEFFSIQKQASRRQSRQQRVKQLRLFATAKPTMNRARLEGASPAPPRSSNWIRSFLIVEQCPPLTPPAIVRKPQRRLA
jgi:hypothetical protein